MYVYTANPYVREGKVYAFMGTACMVYIYIHKYDIYTYVYLTCLGHRLFYWCTPSITT